MNKPNKYTSHQYRKDIFGFGVLCAFFLNTIVNMPADYDLWGYLYFGKLFWELPGFPYADIFSYLPVKEVWTYHEWLTGVIYYPIYSAWGATGLQVLRYLLLAATLLTIFVTARKRGAGPLCTIITIILISGYLKMGYSPVRAQVFTYLFFAVYLYLLESHRLGRVRAALYWLVPMQIVWTNLHGGYLAGIGLVFIYAFCAYLTKAPGRKILPIVLVLCMASTLVNPYGLGYWVYTWDAVTMSRVNIPEWWSVFRAIQNDFEIIIICWLLASALFVGFLLVKQPKKNIYDWAVLGVMFALSLSAIRHMVFFLLAASALVPALVQSLLKRMNLKISLDLSNIKHKGVIDAGVILLYFLIAGSLFVLTDPLAVRIPECGMTKKKEVCYPVRAVEYIKSQKLSGNILTLFEWGEYVIWETYPGCKVGLDGRYETVYPGWLCDKYFDFLYARQGWREFLEEFPPDMILLPASKKVVSLIREEKTWDVALENAGSVLFVRPGASQKPSARGPDTSRP